MINKYEPDPTMSVSFNRARAKEHYKAHPHALDFTVNDITHVYGVSPGTAYKWHRELRSQNNA